MKLVSFKTLNGQINIGAYIVQNDTVVNFTEADASHMFKDMLSLIDAGEDGLLRARELESKAQIIHDLGSVELLAPLLNARRLRDCLAFEKHVRQSRSNRYLFGQGNEKIDPDKIDIPKAWFRKPVYYKGNLFSIVGTHTEVHWPEYSQVIDYELEIALVTSKQGKNVSREHADDYIYGYMIFNDFSARDAQYIEMQTGLGPAKGKDFDTGNAMGPWLVTKDEIKDSQDLLMLARINGEEWSRGSTAEMLHDFKSIICHASDGETFYAGEIIGSGTVGGGCGNEQGRFLKHGDVVELEVPGLGVLSNTIVAHHVKQPPKMPLSIFG